MNTHSVDIELKIEQMVTEMYGECLASSGFCQRVIELPSINLPTSLDVVRDGWYISSGEEEILGLGIAKQWRFSDFLSMQSMDDYRQRLLQDGLQASSIIAGGWAFGPPIANDRLWEAFNFSQWMLPALFVRQTPHVTEAHMTMFVKRGQTVKSMLRYYQDLFESLRAVPQWSELPQVVSTRSYPSPSEWINQVNDAVDVLKKGDLSKLVLARRVDARFTIAPKVSRVLDRLRLFNPSTTTFAVKSQGQTFLGATPECLLHVHDRQIRTMALAGTVPRGKNSTDDYEQRKFLLTSEKDRREHATVVKRITRTLSPFAELNVPDSPQILSLPYVHHLWTPIEGYLRSETSVLSLAALLHPTPAVGGEPQKLAQDWLTKHEGLNRGWYAGGIGFMDLRGQGRLWVALRSALVRGHMAHCYAGCGIMPDSIPERELAESDWKLQAMLRALGVSN